MRGAFLTVAALVLTIVLLHQPASLRLHGTFAQREREICLALLEEHPGFGQGTYVVYPAGHPDKDRYLDQGTYVKTDDSGESLTLYSQDGSIYRGWVTGYKTIAFNWDGISGDWWRVNDYAVMDREE